MANPCPPSKPKTLVPVGTGSDLKFAKAQIGLLRQMARDFRSRFKVALFRNKKDETVQGTLALFSGPSGTGKKIAAEIVAKELRLPIYPVNLNKVVKKYIGETEKNLARALKTAENKKAVLLFDEADALFGKRSEVRDTAEGYANIEVSYFLKKLKAYPGLVILVSNQKAGLDPQTGCGLKYHFKFSALRSTSPSKRR
ncbi:ATP-binding protein [Nitrospira sp. Ecomares 2.1]